MQTPDQRALGRIMRAEWPDLRKEIMAFEKHSIESVIVRVNGAVIGGNYMTNHKWELEKFFRETPSLQGMNLIVAEYFVIKPKYRNRGFGRKLLEFVKKRYLGDFDGIVLKSNIIETQDFYKRLGGEIVNVDENRKTEHHKVWGKDILSRGTTFLYTKRAWSRRGLQALSPP